ncbi:MAG TPA: chorismate-binding protein, partial [Kofleriaceae bacterium]|nr:chorismate-binding protein [Kofleriaceae bacterium]
MTRHASSRVPRPSTLPTAAGHPHPALPGGTRASPIGFAADALRRARGDSIVRVVLPAPLVSLDALLELLPGDDGFVWESPAGDLIAGGGIAWSCEPAGRARLASARSAAGALWPRLRDHVHPEAAAPPARLFAGFAFAPAAACAPPWTGFGDGLLALPRWSYGRTGEHAYLALSVAGAAGPWTARLESLLAALEAGAAGKPDLPPLLSIEEGNPAAWMENVAAIRRAIVAGRCDKIVSARAARLGFAAPPSASAVLRRLAAAYPDCTRFAVRRAGGVFLGATPESLLSVRAGWVTSEAVAGSRAIDRHGAGPAAAAVALLASDKDRGEHDLVVQAIAAALAPHCDRLEVAAEPLT